MAKKIALSLLCVGLVIVGVFVWKTSFVKAPLIYERGGGELFPSYEKRTLLVDASSAKVTVFVADNDQKREQGLMHVRQLPRDTGMLFLFPQKQVQYFWNKNTVMDLDVIWIAGKVIVGVNFLPSIEKTQDIVTVSSSVPVDTVLEVPAGWAKEKSISVGSTISFE